MLFDTITRTVFLMFSNITLAPGGCDGMENEHGFLQISSTDEGKSWGHFNNVQSGLQPSCASCTSPTSGVGLQLQRGPHRGRLLFIGPHNSYHGSDDHGKTYRCTMDLHKEGMDEGSIAELRNGSVMAILRNNLTPKNGGGGRFQYAISHDGGETFGEIRRHPDLVTPTCEASLISFQNQLLFSGPYSTTSRHNLTILASDDDGATFKRSLQLLPAGVYAGYTSLQCGLPGRMNCVVIYEDDISHSVNVVKFASSDVK